MYVWWLRVMDAASGTHAHAHRTLGSLKSVLSALKADDGGGNR